jgi:hypothetical protein
MLSYLIAAGTHHIEFIPVPIRCLGWRQLPPSLKSTATDPGPNDDFGPRSITFGLIVETLAYSQHVRAK